MHSNNRKTLLFVSWVGDSDLLAWAATSLDWGDERKTMPSDEQLRVIQSLKGDAFRPDYHMTNFYRIKLLKQAIRWKSSILTGIASAVEEVGALFVNVVLLSNLDHSVVDSFRRWIESHYRVKTAFQPFTFKSDAVAMSYKESYDWTEKQVESCWHGSNIWFNLTAGSPAMTTALVLFGKLRHPDVSQYIMIQDNDLVDCPIPLDLIEIWNRRQDALKRGRAEYSGIVGHSSELMRAVESAEIVAPYPDNVLILGPNGSGKELLARHIHELSGRGNGAFVAVNCAMFSPDRLESELFGHVKGAYTGAVGERNGKALEAKDGTLFLDEIGDCPLEVQAQLLRFLQPREDNRLLREVVKMGSDKPIEPKPEIRIIAATNQPLRELIQKNKFREDLYYRLSEWTISIPPLNERKEDIPELANKFLVSRYKSAPEGIPHPRLDNHAIAVLQEYDWPGNVRQLQSVVGRAVILAGNTGWITKEIIMEAISQDGQQPSQNDHTIDEEKTLDGLLSEVQRFWISEALSKSGGNKKKAAAMLGLSAQTLANRIATQSNKAPTS